MSVQRSEKRPAKAVAVGEIAEDTLPSVVVSVRSCFAVSKPKMNLDD
jgi:hypothetical protein